MIDAVIEGEYYSFGTPWKRGGEANVFRFQPQANFIRKHGPGPFLVKIYRVGKTLAHQQAHSQRQAKLRNYLTGLPDNVATPIAPVLDREGELIGYVMAFVPGTIPLIKLKRKEYRDENGISIFDVLKIFTNLRTLIRAMHAKGAVIGDLNDKNVLVRKNGDVFLIDADSIQFGAWKCVALVPGFADPRIVRLRPNDPKETLQLIADFDELSDWLAFDVMLCQVVLGTNPMTGGICTLADGAGKFLQGNKRIVSNVSIFHPAVQPSDVAAPLSILPKALRSRWERVFSAQVERSEFPESLLNPAEWIRCSRCETEHGRSQCPICGAPGVIPPVAKPSHAPPQQQTVPSGTQILAAAYHKGSMRYLTYRNGAYHREDGAELWRGAHDARVQFAISGESTIFARGPRFVAVNSARLQRKFETQAANGVATNCHHAYWVNKDKLVRSSAGGNVTIGPTPSHLTSVWVGERFGVAVVQSGILNQILTFDSEGTGFTGTLNLPPELDTITDVHCVVGELAWVTILARTTDGVEIIRCFVVDQGAKLIASADAPRATVPWLDAFSGPTALALSDKLVVAVPGVGLVRIGITGHTLHVEKTSDKHKELVTKEPTVGLFLTKQGLLHVSPTTVTTVS